MPILVANCPRCDSTKITFDVLAYNNMGASYGWQRHYELFCICRNCSKSTVFFTSQLNDTGLESFRDPGVVMNIKGSLNSFFEVDRFISLKDQAKQLPPEFIPDDVANIFNEGTTCLAVQCWNAAGTMFRQCLDIATKSLLPPLESADITKEQRYKLAKRLTWLFNKNILPHDLESLAECIREDGNDGAHDGTLTKEDAMDLLDFTMALLERLYTEPEKIKKAEERRKTRRGT